MADYLVEWWGFQMAEGKVGEWVVLLDRTMVVQTVVVMVEMWVEY
jgi:phage gp46-like protein